MRIIELRLIAFGMFKDMRLDLGGGESGLHVVFGPNEAGKSTALRAIRALLYGIPPQTPDAYVHPYDSLRLGGRLRLSNGEEIEFLRRKGTKGTLLAPDGSRMDDRKLDRFLAGVGPDQFSAFWGIDRERLVQGGREILEGGGDLGETLFAAGSGAAHVRALRKSLDEEAAAIFAARGKNQPVNGALRRLDDLRREQRESTVSAEKWAAQESAAAGAEARIAGLSASVRELSAEKARLERAKRVLPLLAERRDLIEKLGGLEGSELLPADFGKRRSMAEEALRMARERLSADSRQLADKEAQAERMGAVPALAAERETVADLYQRLGSHRKAMEDRSGLLAAREEQLSMAARVLGETKPGHPLEDAASLRALLLRRERIRKLAAGRERLEERIRAARRAGKEAADRAAKLAAEAAALPPVRDWRGLASAVEAARARGDADAERAAVERSVGRIRARLDVLARKLGFEAGAGLEPGSMRIPPAESVARFAKALLRIEEEELASGGERQRIGKEAADASARMQVMRSRADVPSEADLAEARRRRDAAFALLRDFWERGRDVAAEAAGLLGEGNFADLYQAAVRRADAISDLLRSEADRVAELAGLEDSQRILSIRAAGLDAAAAARSEAAAKLDAEWRDLWKTVPCNPPGIHEAASWRSDFQDLLECGRELAAEQRRLLDLDEWIRVHAAGLRGEMERLGAAPRSGAAFGAAVMEAEKLRRTVEGEAAVRTAHERRVAEADAAIASAAAALSGAGEELAEWDGMWREAVSGLGPGCPAPDDALAMLDSLERAFGALDRAAGYESRISGIGRDAAEFRAKARDLAAKLGESIVGPGASEESWVAGIQNRLADVLGAEARRRQLQADIGNLRARVGEARSAADAAEKSMEALRIEARCGPDGDLAAIHERSERTRALRAGLENMEKTLQSAGDGVRIGELEAEAAAVDRDGIDARLGEIGSDLAGKEKELAAEREKKALADAGLRLMGGPSEASAKAEEIQAVLANLGAEVVDYSRLRAAAAILSFRLDDYRRRNQAPLLMRAGAVFSNLTLRAFERLEADVVEDRPVIAGVRPDGSRVPAAGMSDGTRDQLFLALRLAAVEASCAAGEPMPFVADDLLVQFDDERSMAALRVLAELSGRTQIILFTHHGHVRDFAAGMDMPDRVFIHELL